MLQTSCSELLVDTRITDPEEAFARFSALFARYYWESDPPLTLEMLRDLRDDEAGRWHEPPVVVRDRAGHWADLFFGDNGWTIGGYQFIGEQHHIPCHWPIFRAAIERVGAELHAFDGGTTDNYRQWVAPPSKTIAVSLSSRCAGDCPFCYVDRSVPEDLAQLCSSLKRVVSGHLLHFGSDEPLYSICIEFCGYGLDEFLRAPHPGVEEYYPFVGWLTDHHLTMTTMPSLVTTELCETLVQNGFEGVSLSYDSAKVSDPADWVRAAEMVRYHGLMVACNFLIEEVPFDVPDAVVAATEQLNLLVLKPPGRLSDEDRELVNLQVEELKNVVAVAVDNCLAVQIGYASLCMAGDKFIHILPDGTITDCCFGSKCYLWPKAYS